MWSWIKIERRKGVNEDWLEGWLSEYIVTADLQIVDTDIHLQASDYAGDLWHLS